jgi:hypothetical protein
VSTSSSTSGQRLPHATADGREARHGNSS